MKETTSEKTEFVSPPPTGAMWGDTSSFVNGDHSPKETIVIKPPTALCILSTEQDESKEITEGFLSEVSTPDIASKNGQEDIPRGENERNYQTISKLSPTKSLPAARNELKVPNESNRDDTIFPVSECKVEEISQDLFRCAGKAASSRNLNELTETNNSTNPRIQQESEHNEKSVLKRKAPLGNEGRVERKRAKTCGSERSRGKGSAQWSHLSEEELKKLRRVKNRESVEKCRTKQRLRMEALQVEQTCLRLENKNLREAMALVHAVLHDVTMQVTKIKNQMESDSEEEKSEKIEEIRKDVRAEPARKI